MRSSLFSSVTQRCSVDTDVWGQPVSPLKKGLVGCPETSVITSHRYVTSLKIEYSTIKEYHCDDDDDEWWVCIMCKMVGDHLRVLLWHPSDWIRGTNYKRNWTEPTYGHVQRMAEGRLPQIALKWMPKRKRARGRPKKNWMEGIRKAMKEWNLNEGQWEDRKQWSLGVGQRRTFWNRHTYIHTS